MGKTANQYNIMSIYSIEQAVQNLINPLQPTQAQGAPEQLFIRSSPLSSWGVVQLKPGAVVGELALQTNDARAATIKCALLPIWPSFSVCFLGGFFWVVEV